MSHTISYHLLFYWNLSGIIKSLINKHTNSVECKLLLLLHMMKNNSYENVKTNLFFVIEHQIFFMMTLDINAGLTIDKIVF